MKSSFTVIVLVLAACSTDGPGLSQNRDPDLSSSSLTDLAAPADLGAQSVDLTASTPDLVAIDNDAGGGPLGCRGLVNCDRACRSAMCQKACVASATALAVRLYRKLIVCTDAQCPATYGLDGGMVPDGGTSPGPCSVPRSAGCEACQMSSWMKGAPCNKDFLLCAADVP